MTSGSFSVPLTLDHPPILLDDRANGLQLRLTASLHLHVPNVDWLVGDKWRGLEVVRGSGLCLKIKLRWNNRCVPEGLVEAFGRWVSNAEMWAQLLFSTSLQVPERMEQGKEELDVIVDLARSSPTSAATELLISTILPTASLVCINLDFSFCRKGLLRNHTSLPTLLELMKLTDTALRNFWSKEIHGLAPIIGKVGYLSGVSNKAEYVDVIADAIIGVAARTKNRELGRIVEEFEGSKGVRKRTWGVLLDALKVRKGGVGSRLKSLVETGERVIENLEDSLLFDEGTTGWGSDKGGGEGEDIFREEAETEEEDGLFAWSDWNAGEDDVDNIFIWADENEYQEEDEVSLFEDLEDPAVAIDYHGGKNILSLFEELEGLAKGIKDGGKEPLFMEDNELMLEETALPRSEGEGEGEDMIWI